MSVDSLTRKKSKQFAVRIVGMYKYLQDKKEYVLSKQVLRSGTAIGAIVAEGIYAQSRADFVNKMNQALKEAAETEYWLELLKDTDYISQEQYDSIHSDCEELIRILSATVKNSR